MRLAYCLLFVSDMMELCKYSYGDILMISKSFCNLIVFFLITKLKKNHVEMAGIIKRKKDYNGGFRV